MATRTLIALLALTASCALAQQYSGNYVDNGDYDYQDQGQALPPPRPAPAPIQRSIRPNPPQQSLRGVGPTTQRPQPVAILKQINRHNDDGSYTYGFEGADGSFKIETKLATGEVMGKYGYVDDTGKVRTVEYGANKFGFQPVGEGITVAPPTLVDETRKRGQQAPDYDDGQYYEEIPAPPQHARAQPQPQPQRPRPAPRPKAAPVSYQQPQYQPQGEVYQQQQQPRYSQPAPVPRVSQGFGPEPPRVQIAGAAPAPVEPSYQPQRPFPKATQAHFIPSPPQQRSFSQPPAGRPFPQQPAPVHQFDHHGPAPAPAHHFAPKPSSQGRQSGGSYFDQLTKDYALPSGGNSNPIHDIAFGVQY